MKALGIAIATAAIIASTFSAHALRWVAGDGGSCATACERNGGASQTDIWKGDPAHAFYVCKANVSNEGDRAGYNMSAAYGPTKCVVPYGGKEDPQSNYECLCKQ